MEFCRLIFVKRLSPMGMPMGIRTLLFFRLRFVISNCEVCMRDICTLLFFRLRFVLFFRLRFVILI